MRWLLLFTVLLTSVAAFAAGLWLGRKARAEERRSLAYGAISIGLVFLLLRVFFRFVPMVEFSLFPFDGYAIVRPWWAIPPAMLVLGVGSMHMSTPRARKLVGVFSCCLLLVCSQRLWVTARFDPETLHGLIVPATGVCQQTTDYTCGAAAAATLLQHYQVVSSEREMAELCWTNALTGTDELCVARGLRLKGEAEGLIPRFATLDWPALAARSEPSAVTIKWGPMVDHWVVVREASEGGVLVADPLHGVHRYTKAEFLAKWRRFVVYLERADG